VRLVRRKGRGDNGERGFVIVWVAAMMVTLLSVTALAIDVGMWYVVANRVQHQADTAALAGAVDMPNFATATQNAFDNLVANGVCTSASESTTTHSCSGTAQTALVSQIANDPTKVSVRVCRTVNNIMAQVINFKTETVCKTAVAAYQASIAMGSPSSLLSNQPMPEVSTAQSGGWDVTVPTPVNFWLNASGWLVNKSNGDRYLAGKCGTSGTGPNPAELCANSTYNDGGPAGANNGGGEYNSLGYYYVVRVAPGVSGTLGVDVFDPEFAYVGDTCAGDNPQDTLPSGVKQTDTNFDPNLYQTGNTGAAAEYCTGDTNTNGSNVETLFAMHTADQTNSYFDNPIITSAGCTPTQFGAFGNLGATALATPDADSGLTFKDEFRKWVRVCTIAVNNTTTIPQDYLLQVSSALNYNSTTKTLVSNPNYTTEGGQNRFALRAAFVAGTPTKSGSAYNPASEPIAGSALTSTTGVSLFAGGQLPIFQNVTGTANFYLAQVQPSSNSRTLLVDFWDTGDAGGAGTITVSPPSGATYTSAGKSVSLPSFTGCQLRFGATATVTNPSTCAVSVDNSVDSTSGNGRLISLFIPIPATYSCGVTAGTDCWIKVNFNYPSGINVSDATTWSVTMDGNPVRLTQ
jgi:hypothetical protein